MAIVIDIKLGGERTVTNGLTRVSDKLDDLGKKLDTFRDKLKGGWSIGNVGQMAAGVDRTTSAVSRAIGPMERYIHALRQVGIADYSGNSVRQFDAQANLARAARSLTNAQNAMDPQKDLVATSRVAIGPNGQMQLMPLANRLVAAGHTGGFGGILNLANNALGASGSLGTAAKSARLTAEAEAVNLTKGGFQFDIGTGAASSAASLTRLAGAAGPAVLAVGALAAVIGSAVMAIKIAEATLLDRIGAGFIGGGTPAQTAQLSNIGGALGMSGTDIARLARSVQEKSSQGGIWSQFAASQGANIRGGPFGNQNAADTLLRILPALSNPGQTSNEEAMRLARGYGLEDQVGLLRAASPDMRNRALRSAGQEMSPESLRNAADAQIALNLAMTDFKNAVTSLAVTALPLVTVGITALNAGFLLMNELFIKPMIGLLGALGALQGISLGASGSANPVDANTAAVQQNTRAIEAQTRTVYGAGGRAHRGMPSAWQGIYFDRQMDGLRKLQGASTV